MHLLPTNPAIRGILWPTMDRRTRARRLASLLAASVVLTGTLAAQRVWIVDAQQRTGFDFADLPAALNAAAPGDVIRMLPASTPYTPATLSKGVTILGSRMTFQTSWLIRNIPAGQRLTLVDVVSANADQTLRIELRNNQGEIVMDGCRSQDPTPTLPVASSALIVEDCASVSMRRCQAWGSPALAVVRSTLRTSECTWNAVDVAPVVAVAATDANVTFAQPSIAGHLRPGVEATRTALVLTGDGPAYIQGGGPTTPTAAVQTNGGTVAHDTFLALNPFFPGPSFGGTAAVTTRTIPFTLGSTLFRGGQLQFDLAAPSGSQASILLGVPGPALPTPFGDLLLDPRVLVPLITAPVPGTRRVTFRAPVPTSVGFGVTLAIQGVVVENGVLLLSTRTTVTTR
jgi:hypothetical protein